MGTATTPASTPEPTPPSAARAGDTIPLIALLGQAHDALEATFNERLRGSEFTDLSLAHSRNVLRHLSPKNCRRASHLVERSGVSKQALSLQIAHLERLGYVATAPDPDDKRARSVRLTDRGLAAQRVVRRLLRDLDAEWQQAWGEDTWDAVRGRLTEVISSRTDSTC